MRTFIINFVKSPKYDINFHTGRPQAIAKDSADGVLGDIAAAGANAAWNIANLCWTDADSLTLEQICKELDMSETELDICMPLPPAQVQADVLRTPESRLRKAASCPKKTRIKSTTKVVQPILGRINAPRLPNGRYQKLRPQASSKKSQSAVASPMTSSMLIAATLTNAHDASSKSPIMSSTSTTFSLSDLALLIYSTYILDQLKSNSNLELNLHKNFFRKFYYPILISFLANALSSQPH